MHKVVIAVLSALAVVTISIHDSVSGECCVSMTQANCTDLNEESQQCPFKCGDCTSPAPHCGLNACNTFGCGCVAGQDGAVCRAGNCTGPNLHGENAYGNETLVIATGADVLRAADSDNDGVLCMKEALVYLCRMNMTLADVDMEQELNKLDLDHDGKLTADEIDPPAGNAIWAG